LFGCGCIHILVRVLSQPNVPAFGLISCVTTLSNRAMILMTMSRLNRMQ
jgi:hypothetical protein